jgi:hypothetical protein
MSKPKHPCMFHPSREAQRRWRHLHTISILDDYHQDLATLDLCEDCLVQFRDLMYKTYKVLPVIDEKIDVENCP